jgi:hypothetical protein
LAPERAGRAAKQVAENLVEAAHAAEARGQRHLGHRQAGVVQQLLGEQHAPRLGDGDGRGAEMVLEQPPELAATDAQPLGQYLDIGIAAVERTLGDQGQGAVYRVGGAAPEGEVGRDLGPAAQAGPEARLLRRSGRGEEAAVLELGRARGADRPAIDAGRGAADEDVAVEASIVALESAVVGPVVEQFHRGTLLHTCA